MNFAEFRFWEHLFFGLTCILVLRAIVKRLGGHSETFDKFALMLLGIGLLLRVSLLTGIIFLFVAIGTYVSVVGIVRKKQESQRRYLWVLIPLQLLPLLFFKYSDFVVNKIGKFHVEGLLELAIPVGISFYTFQKIAFVVDTLLHQQPIPRFLDYMNFASFFPQIVAGPIERRHRLLPQMEKFRFRWNASAINDGVAWIVTGIFFKCCLADNLALHFSAENGRNAYLIWKANFLFGLRIYFDFAGYSLVALGLARCLEIDLTLNFTSPYCATNITEFWRRWHVTLSNWFRDYIYFPLGGNRTRLWSVNILVVFVISGVWHGAGWNFVLWGGLHALFLIGHRLLRVRLPSLVSWAVTMLGVAFAWLCFYESRTDVLMGKLMALVTPDSYGKNSIREFIASLQVPQTASLAGVIALSIGAISLEWSALRRGGEPYAVFRRMPVLLLMVVLTILLAPGKNNAFIYFAF